MHPDIPGMKAFWTLVSIYPLATIKESHCCFMMEVKNFPIQEVRAMGLKFPGSLGASLAAPLGMRQITHLSRRVGQSQLPNRSCKDRQLLVSVRGSVSA